MHNKTIGAYKGKSHMRPQKRDLNARSILEPHAPHTYFPREHYNSCYTIKINKWGTYICAHARIFFKRCMLITHHIQAMKLYLLNSTDKSRAQKASLTYSHFETIDVS